MEIICKICDKLLKSPSALGLHVNRTHKIDPRVYYLDYLGNSIGKCEVCQIDTDFVSINDGFKRHCSHACSCKNPKVRAAKINTKEKLLALHGDNYDEIVRQRTEKIKKTKLEKYGDANYTNSDKNKETCLRKYGKISATQLPEHKEKVRKTSLEKYGVEHFTQLDSVKEKAKETSLERYGVEHSSQNPEIMSRIKQTQIERYGGMLNGSKLITEKSIQTNLRKYGAAHPNQNKEIAKQMIATRIEKYGTADMFTKYAKSKGYENINDIPSIKELMKIKRLTTNLNKYGITNISQLETIQNKIKITNLEKYGNPCFLQSVNAKNKNTYAIKQYKDTNLRYQSKLELRFIELCLENNIHIENGDILPYITAYGKKANYHVDFKITYPSGLRQLVEIKANHLWYRMEIENGTQQLKVIAAQNYSKENNYLPFAVVFDVEDFINNNEYKTHR